jgi:hypothetical protein
MREYAVYQIDGDSGDEPRPLGVHYAPDRECAIILGAVMYGVDSDECTAIVMPKRKAGALC